MSDKPDFQIFIAYEDTSAGVRAWKASEWLGARVRSDFAVHRDLWKFDLFRDPDPFVRERAVTGALYANMVMVAAHGDGALPIALLSWMQSWVPFKRASGVGSALVALLDPMPEAPETGTVFFAGLRRIAKQAGMDFFCNQPIVEPLAGPASAPRKPRRRRWHWSPGGVGAETEPEVGVEGGVFALEAALGHG